MSDSTDDLFCDVQPARCDPTAPFLQLSFASCLLSFSLRAGVLEANSRELGSNEEASWRLALWPPPASPEAFLIRPLLTYARPAPEQDLVLDPGLLCALSPLADKGLVLLTTPCGQLHLLPVEPQRLAKDGALLGSLGQPAVGLEALRIGDKGASVLAVVGRGGRIGYLCLDREQLLFKTGQLEADISHCQVLHNALFCASGRNLLLRASFENLELRTASWRLDGEFQQGGVLVTTKADRVPFPELCLDPDQFRASEAGPAGLSEGIERLQQRAEALEALRGQHDALDERLRQLNTACRLRQLEPEERKTFFEVSAAIERSPRHRYQLRLDLHNRLEAPLSPAWRLSVHLRLPRGAALVAEQPLPCRSKGASGIVRLDGAFSEAAHTAAGGRVSLSVDLVLPPDPALASGHAGLFSVRLLVQRFSLLDFLLPCDQPQLIAELSIEPPGAWRGLKALQDAFATPLEPQHGARRSPPLAAAVELHEGDRMPFLPASLAWMLEGGGARHDFECFDVPVVLETAWPVTSAYRAPVRRLTVRCAAPRVLLGVAEALTALVVRRKTVTCEELKKDLLLLQALSRYEEDTGRPRGDGLPAEFQALLDANSLLSGLHCV